MKNLLALSAALAAGAFASAHAQITVVDPNTSVVPYYTHVNADDIVSHDRGANGGIFYQTATSSFAFGGLYEFNGGVTTNAVPGSSSQFAGPSVVSIGQYVYYNTSTFTDQLIYKYDPLNGGAPAGPASTTSNYGLYGNGNRLFITAAPDFTTNHIYYTDINPATGDLLNANPAIDLGADVGASGPLAFDAAGNLFYAPGSERTIYRWSKADVDRAIADPLADPLGADGHLWLDYSADPAFADLIGGTSLLVGADGDLLLTITNFSNSALARFGVAGDGSSDGTADALLTASERLGDLRLIDGNLLLADGNQILQVVPEPSALLLSLGALGLCLVARLGRRPQATV